MLFYNKVPSGRLFDLHPGLHEERGGVAHVKFELEGMVSKSRVPGSDSAEVQELTLRQTLPGVVWVAGHILEVVVGVSGFGVKITSKGCHPLPGGMWCPGSF